MLERKMNFFIEFSIEHFNRIYKFTILICILNYEIRNVTVRRPLCIQEFVGLCLGNESDCQDRFYKFSSVNLGEYWGRALTLLRSKYLCLKLNSTRRTINSMTLKRDRSDNR
jgi:hypothetical protein